MIYPPIPSAEFESMMEFLEAWKINGAAQSGRSSVSTPDVTDPQSPCKRAGLAASAPSDDCPELLEDPDEEFDPDWDEDQRLDSPRHGQAAGLNRQSNRRG